MIRNSTKLSTFFEINQIDFHKSVISFLKDVLVIISEAVNINNNMVTTKLKDLVVLKQFGKPCRLHAGASSIVKFYFSMPTSLRHYLQILVKIEIVTFTNFLQFSRTIHDD